MTRRALVLDGSLAWEVSFFLSSTLRCQGIFAGSALNTQPNEIQVTPDLMSHPAMEQGVVPSLQELLFTDPDHFVSKHTDIAAVNLACARGLPKADESQFPGYLALLDRMAEVVRIKTEKSWRLFKIKPAEFHNSENVFRVFTMEHVLRVQFGVKYDPLVWEMTRHGTEVTAWKSADSTEVFVHGVLSEKRTGTCSSLPTFSIAIGRRLGYPLKLMRVPNHTLFRWDDGKEKFNFQHTFAGAEIKPDEYFHTWPRRWDESDFHMNARTKVWLHSMTPKQEVSKFLCNRSIMLFELGRLQEALDAVAAAERFDSINPACAEIACCILESMNNDFAPPPLPMFAQYADHSRLISIPTSMWPSGTELLDTLNPFRDKSKDPKQLLVRISRISNNLK